MAGPWATSSCTSTSACRRRCSACSPARLLAAAYRRPTGIVRHLRPTGEGLLAAVQAMQPGCVRFQGRVLTSGDFLATWACEIAIHHLDLTRELDLPEPSPAALRLARRTIEALAGARFSDAWADARAVIAGSGRTVLTSADRAQLGDVARRLPVL